MGLGRSYVGVYEVFFGERFLGLLGLDFVFSVLFCIDIVFDFEGVIEFRFYFLNLILCDEFFFCFCGFILV